jgi:hypothetical protein
MSETNTVSPLRQRMMEDMAARKLDAHTQRSHISSCKRFTTWLKPCALVRDAEHPMQCPFGALPLAQLALGGFVEQAVELIADGCQVQPGQHVGEGLAVGDHDQSPPAACSYSDRGRNSSGSTRAGAGAAAGRPRAGIPFQVGGGHHPLATASDLAMAGDFATAMADAVPPAGHRHRHRHRLADQPPGHAVGLGVDLDRGIGLDPPDELAHRVERRPPVEWTKGGGLSRANRAIGASPVVPWMRRSAISRIHPSRCPSSAAQLSKRRPAIALCLT